MAGKTPEEAVDDFVEPLRETLACILTGTVFGSGNAVGRRHGLTLYTEGQPSPNVARLSTHGGEGDLLFQLVHLYADVPVPRGDQRGAYEVRTSFYHYRILDREENELVVYHWEPEGISPVRMPHLHVPAAPSLVLPQRAGSRQSSEKTHLGKFHLPTGWITIEAIAELLIRDFKVDPRNSNWEDVLRRSRATTGTGQM